LNALQEIIFTAGQRVHERLYGAQMKFGGKTFPCDSTNVVKDFVLEAGGKSPKTFISTVSFLVENLPANTIPVKGLKFQLQLNSGADWINLQFWHGGLLPENLTYEFMAVDENYNA
jgi:hypothetical protein